jgi:hypothetical protein
VSLKDVKRFEDVKMTEARDLAGPAGAERGVGVPASERVGGTAGA